MRPHGEPERGAAGLAASSADARQQSAAYERRRSEEGRLRRTSGWEEGAEPPVEGVELLADVGVSASGPRDGGEPRRRTPITAASPARQASDTRSADPVRRLLERHRALCERAVDPLEIAAGLEALGLTDRTAARFRHRDVFSLAEELFARAAHPDEPPAAAPGTRVPRVRALAEAAVPLLPALFCLLTVAALLLTADARRLPGPHPAGAVIAGAGAVAVLVALRIALRRVAPSKGALLACGWLLTYALFGDQALEEVLGGGPDLPPGPLAAPDPSVPLGLALAVAPAVWCARWFARAARRRLADSRNLGELASRVRPLVLLVVAVFAGSLFVVEAVTVLSLLPLPGYAHPPGEWAQAAAAALAVLLFLVLLLAVRGLHSAAVAGLGAAAAVELLCLGAVLAARVPSLAPVGRPVEVAVAAVGPPVVPLLACGGAALVLLVHAARALARASAHRCGAAP
ncbi:hypothetical protein [Streptomyces xiaopingdaonensis]|uniref:hypothetical protein n=1 Tax=Streptomyces xiaopingdaonensis TaxID=1565415 RepID=UPI00031B3ACE|nr:hypothetical protein [Streptomyces xiaopingdaonensis]